MVCGTHYRWLEEGGSKRGHCQQNLNQRITQLLVFVK
jgi:hypothetical protein